MTKTLRPTTLPIPTDLSERTLFAIVDDGGRYWGAASGSEEDAQAQLSRFARSNPRSIFYLVHIDFRAVGVAFVADHANLSECDNCCRDSRTADLIGGLCETCHKA